MNAKFTPESVRQQARDMLGINLPEKDLPAVVGLLNGLAADMQAMQAMSVGDAEPAVIYQPSPEDL
jgi:hypothetical protein